MFFKPNIGKLKKKRDIWGLIKALQHSDHNIRRQAVIALKDFDNSVIIEPLCERLNDNYVSVRREVVDILRSMRTSQALTALYSALHDEDKIIRNSVIRTFNDIGWQKTIPLISQPLFEILQNNEFSTESSLLLHKTLQDTLNKLDEMNQQRLVEYIAKRIRLLHSKIDTWIENEVVDIGITPQPNPTGDPYPSYLIYGDVEKSKPNPDYEGINNLISIAPASLQEAIKRLSGEAANDPKVMWSQ